MKHLSILAFALAAALTLPTSHTKAQSAADLIAVIADNLHGKGDKITWRFYFHDGRFWGTRRWEYKIEVSGSVVTESEISETCNFCHGSPQFWNRVGSDKFVANANATAKGLLRNPQPRVNQNIESVDLRQLTDVSIWKHKRHGDYVIFLGSCDGDCFRDRRGVMRDNPDDKSVAFGDWVHPTGITEQVANRVIEAAQKLIALNATGSSGATVEAIPQHDQSATTPGAHTTATKSSIEQRLSLTRDDRVKIQMVLNRLGHDSGEPDGIFGSRTRKAIKAVQKALGLDPTGFLDAALLDQLARAQQETQVAAGTLSQAETCVSERTLGDDETDDNYSVEVEFTNNCAHKVTLSWRHLYGLKYEVDRGAPVKCSGGSARNLEPGESYVTGMGPLPRGIRQRWHRCTQYHDEDVQRQTGYLNCYQSKEPSCPPLPQ